jgi:hypothetical protein
MVDESLGQLKQENARLLEQLYRDVPEAQPSAAQQAATALRERADAIEDAEFRATLQKQLMQRLAELRTCRPVLVSHIRPAGSEG